MQVALQEIENIVFTSFNTGCKSTPGNRTHCRCSCAKWSETALLFKSCKIGEFVFTDELFDQLRIKAVQPKYNHSVSSRIFAFSATDCPDESSQRPKQDSKYCNQNAGNSKQQRTTQSKSSAWTNVCQRSAGE